ncbi:unnamed protein product [Protopolystoma xenopodis]|uniref:Uncharacterized protein n=1 Tax=Protopolystoma xenopodis TaxID=117903 RepID=A0A3S5AY18_9PLAT|nr:unnamed protein product [Protopolystoma xenopodis]
MPSSCISKLLRLLPFLVKVSGEEIRRSAPPEDDGGGFMLTLFPRQSSSIPLPTFGVTLQLLAKFPVGRGARALRLSRTNTDCNQLHLNLQTPYSVDQLPRLPLHHVPQSSPLSPICTKLSQPLSITLSRVTQSISLVPPLNNLIIWTVCFNLSNGPEGLNSKQTMNRCCPVAVEMLFFNMETHFNDILTLPVNADINLLSHRRCINRQLLDPGSTPTLIVFTCRPHRQQRAVSGGVRAVRS